MIALIVVHSASAIDTDVGLSLAFDCMTSLLLVA